MSQPSTISMPPPSAWPLTRAITGTSSVSRSAMPPKPPGRGAAQYSSPLEPRAALHVGAGAEGALAGAGQHDDADVAVPLDRLPDPHQLGFGRLIDRVEAVGPIERDPRDMVVDGELHAHETTPALRARRCARRNSRLRREWLRRRRRAPAAGGAAGRRSGPCVSGVPISGIAPLLPSSVTTVPLASVCSMAERLGQRQHRRAQQILLVEPGEPMLGGVRGEALAEHRLQFGLVRDLVLERRVARIGGEIGQTERRANVLQAGWS